MSDAPSTSAASAPGFYANLVPAEEKEKMIFILLSSDKVEVEVPEDAAFQSNLLKNMVKDVGIEDLNSPLLKEPLKVNINAVILVKLIDWCIQRRGEVYYQPKGDDEDPRIQLTEEDEKWMDVSSEKLLDLLIGANYLDIPGIVDIITQKIANMANGKTLDEIREIYGLVNDLTIDQEEEVYEHFKWVEAYKRSD